MKKEFLYLMKNSRSLVKILIEIVFVRITNPLFQRKRLRIANQYLDALVAFIRRKNGSKIDKNL